MKLKRDIYVIVSERASERGHNYPLIWETRADDASYEEVREMQDDFPPCYGKTCIAKLTIIEGSERE